jgi:hypothetical protein
MDRRTWPWGWTILDREDMMVGQTVGPKAWDSDEAKALMLSLINPSQG